MHHNCPDTGDVGGLKRAQDGVLEHPRPDPLAVPTSSGGQAGQHHHRHRVPGQTLGQPLRGLVVPDLANGKAVVTDHSATILERHIGLGTLHGLVAQGMLDQEGIERLAPAIKPRHVMRSAELRNRQSHAD